MKKIVYNNCHGGFALSKLAAMWLAARGVEEAVRWLGDSVNSSDGWGRGADHFYPYTLARHSTLLVECVEALGPEQAGGSFSDLKLAEVEDLYMIEEYDGLETVATPDNQKWLSAKRDPEVKKDVLFAGSKHGK